MKGPGLTINLPVRDSARERECERARAGAGAGARGWGARTVEREEGEKERLRKKAITEVLRSEDSLPDRQTDGERQREALKDSVRKSAIELGLRREPGR